MRYNDIRAALETRLASLPGVPPVSPENVRIPRPEGVTYLETSVVPIRTRISTIRGSTVRQLYKGWFQVRIMTPLYGGAGDAYDLADSIAAHFEPGQSITIPGGGHLTIEYAEIGNKSLRDTHFSTILNVGWYLHS
jgi:hypothetical protein